MQTDDAGTTCGFFALVGRANVGKSTLLNAIVGQKLAITSPKPQTTRWRTLGVRTQGRCQLVFVDTPGWQQRPRRILQQTMNREVKHAVAGVDALVVLIEALRWTAADEHVARFAADTPAPLVVVVSKIDRVSDKRALLPFLGELGPRFPGAEIVPVSARNRDNLEVLEICLARYAKPGAFAFEAQTVTERSERFLAAELIREKLVRRLGAELPYSIGVLIERYAETAEHVAIDAIIWVEKDSQKAIVIGRGGEALKQIGTLARADLQRMLGRAVSLQTWVKVKQGWADDIAALAQLGFET
jgi:GTP-binding protein Era